MVKSYDLQDIYDIAELKANIENISALQNLLAGSALVYWYDSADVQTALNNEWGHTNVALYHCPPDTIRIYLPNLDTQMDYDWERHRYFSLQEYKGRFQDLSRAVKKHI